MAIRPRIAVLAAVALAAAPLPAQEPAPALALKIVDGAAEPVAGATVELLPHPLTGDTTPVAEATSDPAGLARFDAPAGVYRARVRADGFVKRWSGPLAVPADAEMPVLAVSPGSPVSGRAVDTDGNPLATARLCLTLLGAGTYPAEALGDTGLDEGELCVDADPEGRVGTGNLPHGRYDLEVGAPGKVPRARILELDARTGPLEWRLSAGGGIAGRVEDRDKQPVARAVVRLHHRERGVEREDATDDEGRFDVRGLAPGHWSLRIEPPRAAAIARDGIVVAEGRRTSLGTLTVRPGLAVEGRIVDSAGDPIRGAEIGVRESGPVPRRLRQVESDEHGWFVAAGLSERPVHLLIDGPEGHAAAALEDVTPPAKDLRVELEDSGSVCGTVRSEAGDVPAGVVLEARARREGLLDRHDELLRSRTRDVDVASGRFCIRDVAPGEEVGVTARAPGYQRRTTTVVVEPGLETGPVELVLQRGLRLAGTVVDADGGPLSEAWVRSDKGARVATNDRGEFRLEGLEPGMNKIVGEHREHAPAELAVMLPLADDETFVLQLGAGGTIEGTVRHHDGRPAEGITIALERPSRRVLTDDNGAYRLEHVPAGSRRVSRTVPGRYDDFERRDVDVVEGESTRVDFELGVVLEGRLLRGGGPVAGAALALARPDDVEDFAGASHGVHRTFSGEDGSYRLAGVRPGWGTLTVEEPRQITLRPFEVPAGDAPRVDVHLPDRLVRGRVVTEADERGLAGAHVSSNQPPVDDAPPSSGSSSYSSSRSSGHGIRYHLSSQPQVQTSSAQDGSFELFVEDAAQVRVGAWYRGFKWGSMEADPSEFFLIELGREVRVAVNLRDAGGREVSDSHVCFLTNHGGRSSRACSIGGSSRIEQTMDEGPCTILASATGFAARVLERELKATDDGAVDEITVDLVPGAPLRIRLVGQGGDEAAVSSLIDPSGRDRTVLVDRHDPDPATGDLRWTTWPLEPGPWTVAVETDPGEELRKVVDVVPGGPIDVVFP